MMYEQKNIENHLAFNLNYEDASYRDANKPVSVHTPLLLWVNLMTKQGPTPLSSQLENFCDVHLLDSGQPGDKKHSHEKPDFICFEYDYPDCDSLNLLKKTRAMHPGIPVIMFTVHHSEELAIWALRNRVWDYYYKPISKNRINDLSREIINCCVQTKNRRQSDERHFINSSYPNEVRFKHTDDKQVVIDTAINYLCSNYSQKLTEQEVSDLCQLSRFQFARLFKKMSDQPSRTTY